jgi:hypothetical protein
MFKQDIIIRDLAAKYKKDPRIIEAIVYSPLKFAKKVFEDPKDNRPIRIKYFGVFVQKPIFNKVTRMKKLLDDIRKDMVATVVVMGSVLQFPVNSDESAKKIIDLAEETDDYDKIRMIWESLREYTKNE